MNLSTFTSKKGSSKAKFSLLIDTEDIQEVYSENMNPAEKCFVKKTILDQFEIIVEEWNKVHEDSEK